MHAQLSVVKLRSIAGAAARAPIRGGPRPDPRRTGWSPSGRSKPEVFVQFAEYSILSGATADPAVHLPDSLRLLVEGSGFTAGAPDGRPRAARPGARIDAASDKLQMLAVALKVRDDLFADVIA